jgi:hypothetical protein
MYRLHSAVLGNVWRLFETGGDIPPQNSKPYYRQNARVASGSHCGPQAVDVVFDEFACIPFVRERPSQFDLGLPMQCDESMHVQVRDRSAISASSPTTRSLST